ncbi:MAG: amidohydrolase [Devosia sp.]|uniref:amidohydrolase family protein n=1 Tax=Devosia sp. TaxID=1871048 RepID=UPI001AC87229|nr:amidohydrolase family protein [Devosia sp.]MBN9315663.1 amidohydrolase [Devosia sp.]
MAVPGLSIVDSHAHVWINDPEFPWSPDAAATPTYDATPASLLEDMSVEAIAATVLVQYIGYRWHNEYVARAVAAAPAKFAGVCRVNPEDPAAPEHLNYWTKERGLHGVRISPEPGPRGDWFRRPLMDPFFGRAAELGVPVVLLAKAERLPELVDILSRHPDVDVVIDHFADCDLRNAEHRHSLAALADNPRVFLKTGHMWANSTEPYPWRDQIEVLREVLVLFGASRIMWGSDWPLCREHTTYGRALAFLRHEATQLSRDDLGWILGGTAKRLWQFGEQSPVPTTQPSGQRDHSVSSSSPGRD